MSVPAIPTRMTEQTMAAIIATIIALDSRMTALDADTAKLRIRAWWRILQDVDPAWAMRYVEHAYSQLRDFPITPAEIRTEWLRASERDETVTAREEIQGSGGRATPVVMDWLRASWLSLTSGGPVLPIPEGVGRLSDAADRRGRRCVYHELCACPHTHCRAGWEDAPHVIRNGQDREYEAVKRCEMCRDALLMAEERGIAKRPQSHGRRR